MQFPLGPYETANQPYWLLNGHRIDSPQLGDKNDLFRRLPTECRATGAHLLVEAIGRLVPEFRERGDGRLLDKRVFGEVGTHVGPSRNLSLTSSSSRVTPSFAAHWSR